MVGSRAYGLENEESDTDRRGVYLPPADLHWSLYGVPEQLESPQTEEVYWEVQKFVIWRSRPIRTCWNASTRRWSIDATPLAGSCWTCDQSFSRRWSTKPTTATSLSQFKKLQGDLRNKGSVKWKHVMHLLRLLSAGITILRRRPRAGAVEEQREQLLAIKRGEMPLEDVRENGACELHERI